MRTLILSVVLLAFGSACLAKDELIPTDKRSQNRQQKPPNPLENVAGDMHSSARRLEKNLTEDTTQDIQKRIIEKLDILIEAARQQQQQSQQNSSQAKQRQQKQQQPQPSQGQQQQDQQTPKPEESQARKASAKPGFGPDGKGKADGPIRTDAKEWGNLPPAIRDQLLQTQGEGFPRKYRELLRRYYRELAKPE